MPSASFKKARNGFERDLALEERTSRMRPNALNSGNEQQSELAPSLPSAPAGTPRARPKPSAPRARPPSPGPLPPRRPPPGPGQPPGEPVIPTPDPPVTGTPPVFTFPQYDPLGNPTGQDAPPAPGSSTEGWPRVPQPTDMIPPLTGPGSDRLPAAAPNPLAGGPDVGAALAGAIGPTPGPQGLLDALSGYLKRLPPLRNPF